ncbi:MAG TPA: NUDIX domain-containing protein, partial [Candidatus Dormibacteraeota bacterium]|nr:NUDIX domain-containing protein [Candidatus Dormibacteraeota bacterium]
DYTFIQRGTRIHKTVHYFFMVPTGGDLARHDHEFEEVRWVSFDDAAHLLTFDTERALVLRARAELASAAGAGAGSGSASAETEPSSADAAQRATAPR